MRCWRARTRRRTTAALWAAVLAVCAGCSTGTPDTGLSVAAMDGHLAGGRYRVTLELDIGLTEAVEEALHNGVPIRILAEVRVRDPRGWLWSRTIAEETRGYTLSYHSLSSQYLVQWPSSEEYRAYPSRQVALSVLETPEPWQLELPSPLSGGGLVAEARVRLDLQALPAPLRLVAYFSPDWRIGSGWRREKLSPLEDGTEDG